MKESSQAEMLFNRREGIRSMVDECFNHSGMTKILEWHNPEEERLYSLLAGKDLFGDLTIERQWSSCVTNKGNRKRTITSRDDIGRVVTMIDGLLKRRLLHGYRLITEVSFDVSFNTADKSPN